MPPGDRAQSYRCAMATDRCRLYENPVKIVVVGRRQNALLPVARPLRLAQIDAERRSAHILCDESPDRR